jgi:hypothetical protein
MPRVRMGPKGPKSSLAGKKGTNRPAMAPKGSSGAKGGKLHKRLTVKTTSLPKVSKMSKGMGDMERKGM